MIICANCEHEFEDKDIEIRKTHDPILDREFKIECCPLCHRWLLGFTIRYDGGAFLTVSGGSGMSYTSPGVDWDE